MSMAMLGLYETLVCTPGELAVEVAETVARECQKQNILITLAQREDCPASALEILAAHSEQLVREAALVHDSIDENVVVRAIMCETSRGVIKLVAARTTSQLVTAAIVRHSSVDLDNCLLRNSHTCDEHVIAIMERTTYRSSEHDTLASIQSPIAALVERPVVAQWYALHGTDMTTTCDILAACADEHGSRLGETAWNRIVDNCVYAVLASQDDVISDLVAIRALRWQMVAPPAQQLRLRNVFLTHDWSHSAHLSKIEEMLGLHDSHERNVEALHAGDIATFVWAWHTQNPVQLDMLLAMLAHPACDTEKAVTLITERMATEISQVPGKLLGARVGDREFAVQVGILVPYSVSMITVDRSEIALEVINTVGHLGAMTGTHTGHETAARIADLLDADQYNDILWPAVLRIVNKVPTLREVVAARVASVMADTRQRAVFECLAPKFTGTVGALFSSVEASARRQLPIEV